MGVQLFKFLSTYSRFKPHFLMVMTQVGYAFLYCITEASFNHGLNPHIYTPSVFEKELLLFFQFNLFLVRPKLTLALFAEKFVLSSSGKLGCIYIIKYISPTFIAAMINTVAFLTLVIAVALRLEVLDIRSSRGMSKILGTSLSFAGVLTMTLNSIEHENWLKGSLLAVASCMTWSIWYIMQVVTLKKDPAQLSLTVRMSILGAAQSAVRVVCSGLIIYVRLWGTEQKGPVIVTMFDPLSTLMVAVVAYFIVGERLHKGKGDNEPRTDSQVLPNLSYEEQKESEIQIIYLVRREEISKAKPNT
ncbi:hypothetical protein MKX01_029487 [Papaver californicum]|nr:hypothetical protein MKX01_029487 [Papaver californicum]